MTTAFTLACPHCYQTIISGKLHGNCRRCLSCNHRAHVSAFERAGARVEPEALRYEGITGFTVADLEAWADEQMEAESD